MTRIIIILLLLLFISPLQFGWAEPIDAGSTSITSTQDSLPMQQTERQLLLDEIDRLKKQLHDAELEAWEAKKALEDYKSWAELELHRKEHAFNDSSSTTPQTDTTTPKKAISPLEKHSSLYTDILDWTQLYRDDDWTSMSINFETALSNHLALVLGMNSSSLTIDESAYEYNVTNLGLVGGVKYFPFYQGLSQSGLWVGTNIDMIFYNDEYKDYFGSISNSSMQYLLGTEIGYKWVLGKNHWFFISPYIGYYYPIMSMNLQVEVPSLNHSTSFSYTGLNIGITF